MKVKDLLKEIEDNKKEYPDFLEWDVYTEQLTQSDKVFKRKNIESTGNKWDIVKDSEGWEYFKCAGFWTKWPDKKLFSINVNY